MAYEKPHIVVLISDNQRVDTLSILGKSASAEAQASAPQSASAEAYASASPSACQTPTWDRVAEDGVLFENLRCTSPICTPARASLFTGMQPQRAGTPHNPSNTYIDKDETARKTVSMEITVPHIAHYLREIGYQCIHVGKWHLGVDNFKKWFDWYGACANEERDYTEWCKFHGVPDGFVFHESEMSKPYRSVHPPHMSVPYTGTLYLPEDKEHNAWTMARAFEFFGLWERKKPLFMIVSMEGPHPPFMVPEKYYDMYDPLAIPEPRNWNPTEGEPSFLQNSYYRRLRNEWGKDFSSWQKSMAVYWGYVTYIDNLFGRFVSRLEEEKMLDNTLLVMLSDHGEMMGQHGLWQKFCPYEEALRVPWAMRWPGVIEPGKRCTMDVSGIDVGPTLLAAAGVDPQSLGLEGENVLPYITDDRPLSESRDCFSQYNLAPTFKEWHGIYNWRLIVRRPWKYVLHENGEQELYNLQDDPCELVNRASEPQCRAICEELSIQINSTVPF